MWCMDKMSVDKIMLDKTPVVYDAHHILLTPVKNAREDKMLAIIRGREGKMQILSKHFIYHTDG